MESQDKNMVCVDCHKSFVWTTGEQEFYASRDFTNPPKRCKECKANRDSSAPRGRIQTAVKCAQCGKATTVPFKPTEGKPVYCKECFGLRKR